VKLYEFVRYLAWVTAALSGYFLAKDLWLVTLLLLPVWVGMLVVSDLKEQREESK
jgi:hypothetical protein